MYPPGSVSMGGKKKMRLSVQVVGEVLSVRCVCNPPYSVSRVGKESVFRLGQRRGFVLMTKPCLKKTERHKSLEQRLNLSGS